MPHKHKRKRNGENDNNADFNLPPTAKAAPLPSHRPKAVVAPDDGTEKRSNKRRKPNSSSKSQQSKVADDTPKHFARMMAFQNEGKKIRKGLDDGTSKPKDSGKKKSQKPASSPADATTDTKIDAPTASSDPTALKIKPGERLSDFALRVNQSLPLSGVPKHSTKPTQNIPGVKEKVYLTKHNKRLARMQSQWREDEKRLQEKRADEEADALDQKEEDGMLWMDVDEARKQRKGKKSQKEGDIWGAIARNRKQDPGGGLSAGTAAQAPPVLKGVKNMFKERRHIAGGVGVKG